MEFLILAILFILGMPFWGIYLMTDKGQKENRGLGVAVFIVGIIIWWLIKMN